MCTKKKLNECQKKLKLNEQLIEIKWAIDIKAIKLLFQLIH